MTRPRDAPQPLPTLAVGPGPPGAARLGGSRRAPAAAAPEPALPPARRGAAERRGSRNAAARPGGRGRRSPEPAARGLPPEVPPWPVLRRVFAALETFWRKPGLRSASSPGSGRTTETKAPARPSRPAPRRERSRKADLKLLRFSPQFAFFSFPSPRAIKSSGGRVPLCPGAGEAAGASALRAGGERNWVLSVPEEVAQRERDSACLPGPWLFFFLPPPSTPPETGIREKEAVSEWKGKK